MIDRTTKDGPGPKMDPRRHAYMLRFGIVRTKKPSRCITDALMMQLGACRSEEARRLILGVSERMRWEVFHPDQEDDHD